MIVKVIKYVAIFGIVGIVTHILRITIQIISIRMIPILIVFVGRYFVYCLRAPDVV